MKTPASNRILSQTAFTIICLLLLLPAHLFAQSHYQFAWGRGLSGGDTDGVYHTAMAVDLQDNVIELGYFADTIYVQGAPHFSQGGLYMAKFDANGSLVWMRHEGTNRPQGIFPAPTEVPLDISTDSLGYIYTLFYQKDTSGQNAYMLGKYNPAGQLLNIKYYYTNATYVAGKCVAKPQGGMLACFCYSDSLVLATTTLHTHNTANYAFALLDFDNSLNQGDYMDFGGKQPWVTGISYGHEIWYSSNLNSVNVVGTYDSLVVSGPNFLGWSFGTQVLTGSSGFIADFMPGGARVAPLATPLTGNYLLLEPNGIVTDHVGNSYVVGRFSGDAVMGVNNQDTLHTVGSTGTDIFYAMIDSSGYVRYGKSITSVGTDYGGSIVMLSSDTILFSARLGIGGAVVLGDTLRGNGFLMAFSKHNGSPQWWTGVGGDPLWTLQEPAGFSCSMASLKKGISVYVGGSVLDKALFNTDTIANAALFNNTISEAAAVAKLQSLPGCGLQAVISGADTIISCQAKPTLVATVFGGSGNYQYSWSPSQYLDNANTTVPTVNQQVHLQQFILTATDPSAGCIARDTVVVGVYLPHFDTLYSCNGQPVTLNLGAGATYYNWPNTNTTTQTLVADTAGQYIGIANYNTAPATCGALTSLFTVIDSCSTPNDSVWPGDANSNGVADLYDVLNIGIGYNSTGPVRTNASTVWVGQACQDWQLQFLSGLNLKHADCDGNGVIDSLDVDVVNLNYGLTHQKAEQARHNPSVPDLYLTFTADSVASGTMITAHINLGTSSMPVGNAYGVAFSVNYDNTLVDSNITAVWDAGSWLGQGSSPVHLEKNFFANGRLDLAYSRTNHVTVSGSGEIGYINLYIQDNIIGKDYFTAPVALSITGAVLVDSAGNTIDINEVGDTVIAYQEINGIGEQSPNPAINVYPNPNNGQFAVQLPANVGTGSISLVNTLGQTLLSQPITGGSTQVVDATGVAAGVYYIRVQATNLNAKQPVMIW